MGGGKNKMQAEHVKHAKLGEGAWEPTSPQRKFLKTDALRLNFSVFLTCS